MNKSKSRTLSTVETSFRIVETIANLDGARVSEIANQLDIPASTVHGHLQTLYELSYLTKIGDEYHIGMQFLNRGGQVRQRREGYQLAKETTNQLAKKTGERVQFVVEEHGRGYYVHTAIGENAVRADARVGKRIYLHDSSAGKAILARLSDAEINDVMDKWGLPEFTESTITERDEFFDEIEKVREQGYAINREESHKGLNAIGAAVETHQQEVLGAFSISGPSNRLDGERMQGEIISRLRGVTNELELKLSYL